MYHSERISDSENSMKQKKKPKMKLKELFDGKLPIEKIKKQKKYKKKK